MDQNYPKWPKNDARIYALFLQILLIEKKVPQTFFSLRMYGHQYSILSMPWYNFCVSLVNRVVKNYDDI